MNQSNDGSNKNNDEHSIVKTLYEYIGGLVILLILIAATTTGMGIFVVAPMLLLTIVIGINYYFVNTGKRMRECVHCGTPIRVTGRKKNILCPSCKRPLLKRQKGKSAVKKSKKKGDVIYMKDKFKPDKNSDNS